MPRMVDETEQQRFLSATQIEQTIGKDVAALQVGSQLHLIDGNELGLRLSRHGLDGANGKSALPRRVDLLFAGHQGHMFDTDLADDAAVDLPCEQPQRQGL